MTDSDAYAMGEHPALPGARLVADSAVPRDTIAVWDNAGLARLLEAVRRHDDDTRALGPFLRARLEPYDNGMAGHTKRHLDALRELVDTLVPIATGDAGDLEGDAGVAWQALTILASTWRHHPDYREGWAP